MSEIALKNIRVKLAAILKEYDTLSETIGGCGDGNCLVRKPTGQHTNGGCRCFADRHKAHHVMWAARRMRNAIEEISSHSITEEIVKTTAEVKNDQ